MSKDSSMKGQSFFRFLSRFVPLVAWIAFIFFASSDGFKASNTSEFVGPIIRWLFPDTSPERLALIHSFTRKFAHFAEYAVLGILAARAFRTSPNTTPQRHWFVISLALVVVYSLLDEYHQSFVPTRTASIFDSLIDIVGGLTALIVIYLFKKGRDQNSTSLRALPRVTH